MTPAAFAIYCYRFVLGVAGVFVMGQVFDKIRSALGEGHSFIKTVSGWGGETLAIYILQTIAFEVILSRVCGFVYARHPMVLSQQTTNLVGYVIAPVLLFLCVHLMVPCVEKVRRMVVLNWIFGFKMNIKEQK